MDAYRFVQTHHVLKRYIMSVARALHCPQRNSDQRVAVFAVVGQAEDLTTAEAATASLQPEEGPLHHKQAQEDELLPHRTL